MLELYNIPLQFQNQANIQFRFHLNTINFPQLINFNISYEHLPVMTQAAA
jgi:hypothetical protein